MAGAPGGPPPAREVVRLQALLGGGGGGGGRRGRRGDTAGGHALAGAGGGVGVGSPTVGACGSTLPRRASGRAVAAPGFGGPRGGGGSDAVRPPGHAWGCRGALSAQSKGRRPALP